MYMCNTCLYISTPKFQSLYSLNYPGFLGQHNNFGRGVEITTDIEWNDKVGDERDGRIDMDEDDLRRLNFHSEKVPWPMIEKRLSEINWDKIYEGKNAEECTYIFIEIIKSIC